MLVSSDYLGEMLLDGQIFEHSNKALYAQNTVYGWVIIGPIRSSQSPRLSCMLSLPNNNIDRKHYNDFGSWKNSNYPRRGPQMN